MSGQHCKNYDVKWETVHCYPQNVERCCTSFISKVIICFPPVWPICFAIITNHIMTGPLGNSEFCYPQISMFSPTSSQETLRFSGNKIHCSPQDKSSSVNCVSVCSWHKIVLMHWTSVWRFTSRILQTVTKLWLPTWCNISMTCLIQQKSKNLCVVFALQVFVLSTPEIVWNHFCSLFII